MSILKRGATCLAVIVSAVAATTVVTASPSSAASDVDAWALCKMGIILCGDAHFVSDAGGGNERLEISDDNSDGYGVAVENYRYDLADIGPYFGWNRKEGGTVVNNTPHITEGARFEIRICPEQDAVVLYQYCSAWENGYA
jgi:hypothetical protein